MKCINKIIPHGCTDENSSIKKQHSTILKMVIGRKCILLDVPYYHNIGDVLIWKGEMSFYQNITYNACIMPRMKLVLFLK